MTDNTSRLVDALHSRSNRQRLLDAIKDMMDRGVTQFTLPKTTNTEEIDFDTYCGQAADFLEAINRGEFTEVDPRRIGEGE